MTLLFCFCSVKLLFTFHVKNKDTYQIFIPWGTFCDRNFYRVIVSEKKDLRELLHLLYQTELFHWLYERKLFHWIPQRESISLNLKDEISYFWTKKRRTIEFYTSILFKMSSLFSLHFFLTNECEFKVKFFKKGTVILSWYKLQVVISYPFHFRVSALYFIFCPFFTLLYFCSWMHHIQRN